jgi:hypothetical protein
MWIYYLITPRNRRDREEIWKKLNFEHESGASI